MRRAVYVLFTLIVLASVLAIYMWPPPANGQPPPSENTLNLYGIDPYTLDPALSGDATSHEYIMQIFSGLVKFDENLEIAPDIATGWDNSECSLIYTFYINPDVYYHNGKKLTAYDFKDSWERACNPDTGSQTAQLYLGDIQGASEVISGQATQISGVSVKDDYTLEVVLDEPKSYFLYKLAYPTTFAVDTETAAGQNWWHSGINGTGPFKLKTWQQGSRIELERNEKYYGKVANIDRVVYHLWAGIQMDLYETGRIDVAGVGATYIDKIRDERNVFYRELIETPALRLMYIGFDFTTEPFNDPDVRLAFSLAIDRNKIIELVYKDTAYPAGGVLPPGMPGFNHQLEGAGFDPDLAKELVGKSTYGSVENLPAITLTTGGYGGSVSRELQAIIYQWQENLGVEVTVRQIEPNEFLYNLTEEKDELFYYGWVADYPHPQNFLEILFSKDSSNNVGRYYNSQFEELISTAAREQNTDLSMELYQQAEQILIDDAALIPLSFGKNQVLVKPYVKGYNLGPLGAVPLNQVWIEAS